MVKWRKTIISCIFYPYPKLLHPRIGNLQRTWPLSEFHLPESSLSLTLSCLFLTVSSIPQDFPLGRGAWLLQHLCGKSSFPVRRQRWLPWSLETLAVILTITGNKGKAWAECMIPPLKNGEKILHKLSLPADQNLCIVHDGTIRVLFYCSISWSLFPCQLVEHEQCPNIKKPWAPCWHLPGWRWPRVGSIMATDNRQEQELL